MCAFWQFPFILWVPLFTHTHIFPRHPSLPCWCCPASAGWMRINVTDTEREWARRVRLSLSVQSQIVESPWQHNSSTQAPLRASRYPIRATATWACLRDSPSLHWSLNQDWGSPPRREPGKETQRLDLGWTLVHDFWCKTRPPTGRSEPDHRSVITLWGAWKKCGVRLMERSIVTPCRLLSIFSEVSAGNYITRPS